jgi:hypothetical protein
VRELSFINSAKVVGETSNRPSVNVRHSSLTIDKMSEEGMRAGTSDEMNMRFPKGLYTSTSRDGSERVYERVAVNGVRRCTIEMRFVFTLDELDLARNKGKSNGSVLDHVERRLSRRMMAVED